MALFIDLVLFKKKIDKTIFFHHNVPVIVSEKQPFCHFYEKKMINALFYFKYITIPVEFPELV